MNDPEKSRQTMDMETLRYEQSRFLATISHEVRTPLNAISGMSQLLAQTVLTPSQTEYLETIQQAGAHLLSMMDNLLDMAKYGADEMVLSFDSFDVTNELKAAIKEIKTLLDEKGLKLTLQCTPDVSGIKSLDVRRFRQCLSNLLSNAAKFTDRGKIKLSAWVAEDQTGEKGMLYVTVTDTGKGIQKEEMEKIFLPFHQQDEGIKRQFDGAGLGLPVTKMLARKMGGDLEVTSTPGVGSTFALSMQYRLVQRKPETELKTHGRILVVEDNPTNQRLISLVLDKLGHTCMLAANGEEGVQMFTVHDFDLILMDLHMPIKDGFEASRDIRHSRHANAHLPIIALTADVRTGIEDKVAEAGMDGYLAKPFELPQLAAMIQTALQGSDNNSDTKLQAQG